MELTNTICGFRHPSGLSNIAGWSVIWKPCR